jgi:starch synthase
LDAAFDHKQVERRRKRVEDFVLKVLFLSAEVAPFAKVGGLADVAGSLPKALVALGHDVRVMMPSYRMIEEDPRWQATTELQSFPVPLSGSRTKSAYLKRIDLKNVPHYLLGTDEWFCESVSSPTVYLPGSDQHLFFAKGVLSAVKRLGWIPDVIHCNDWHTGFVPVILRECGDKTWDSTAAVFTIHNLAYQGEFGEDILSSLDLPLSLFNLHQVEAYGRVNFLKAGCVFSDQVNTVSPRYAEEIQTPEFGCRLEGLMQHLAQFGRLSGILNGIDTDEFNPQTDPHIAAHFSATDLEGKALSKKALLEEVGLQYAPETPLLGVVSRLSSQKGMDIMLDTAEKLFALDVQLIVQGLGDAALAEQFKKLEQDHPLNFRFVEKFDASFAQRVYAGSDIFLMPSSFEPCGLGQLIAMRYGTVPVVRNTGGLGDTVVDGETGFVFQERTSEEFMLACQHAVTGFRDRAKWRKMVKSALNADFSWSRSAHKYVDLYTRALADRTGDTSAIAG